MTDRQIGLRKRTRPFTQVPNDVVDDFTIGYRELGLLVRILRMPDGFVIRSEQLCSEGKGKTLRGRRPDREGREAIRTALRNLAMAGYYRLVREQHVDGTFSMATDVSEDPVEVWAAQAVAFGGRPVHLMQQDDGAFHVKYPDGTILPDSDMPPETMLQQAEQESARKPGRTARAPKPKNPSSGNRAPVNPGSGDPDSGSLGPLKKMVSKDGQQDSVPASQVRRHGDEDAGQPDGQITIDGDVEPPPDRVEAELNSTAMGIGRSWVNKRAEHHHPVVMRSAKADPIKAIRDLVFPYLKAGYTENEVRNALAWTDDGIPAGNLFEAGLRAVRGGWVAGRAWVPGSGRGTSAARSGRQRTGTGPMAGTNRHVDDISAERRRAENPFNSASRQSDYVGSEGAVA
jgi:hypothetical protein